MFTLQVRSLLWFIHIGGRLLKGALECSM